MIIKSKTKTLSTSQIKEKDLPSGKISEFREKINFFFFLNSCQTDY